MRYIRRVYFLSHIGKDKWLLYKLTKEVVLRVKLSVFMVAVDQMLQVIIKSKLILKSVKNRKLDLYPR